MLMELKGKKNTMSHDVSFESYKYICIYIYIIYGKEIKLSFQVLRVLLTFIYILQPDNNSRYILHTMHWLLTK